MTGQMKGPRFCWHCNRQLQNKTGGGWHFVLVRDALGHDHRVHIGCVDDATQGGNARKVPDAG